MESELESILGKDAAAVVKLSPSKRLESLRSIARNFPTGEGLAKLQKIISDLMEEEIKTGVPMEPTFPIVSTSEYDVLITDIGEHDYPRIAAALGVTNLEITSEKSTFQLQGILYGVRIFFPLVVTTRRTSVTVIFLFDTGAPTTFLRRDTFEALGFKEFIPGQANVDIAGTTCRVELSHSHFENVNLLGYDFAYRIGARVILDYKELSFTIER